MGAPIEIGRDEARRRAADELAKAKYQSDPDWLIALRERVQEWIDTLLDPWIGPTPGAPGAPSWVFVAVVAAVVIGLGVIVWKVGLPRWRRRVPDAEVATDPETSAEDYRSAARRAADAGDHDTAVRELFRAMVRTLEHRTIIDPRPGRTALEAAGSAALAMPAVEPELHTAAVSFNDVMYGRLPADAERYHRMVTAVDAIDAAAERFRHPGSDEVDETADEGVVDRRDA